jgi:hypothetical protein
VCGSKTKVQYAGVVFSSKLVSVKENLREVNVDYSTARLGMIKHFKEIDDPF